MEESIGSLIVRISSIFSNYINKHFSELDEPINIQHLIILMILWQNDGQKQQNLADKSCKDKASTARLLSSMETKGLIIRQPDKNDTRKKLVYLTEKSNRLKPQILSHLRKDMHSLSEGINMGELGVCIKVLNTIYGNILKSN